MIEIISLIVSIFSLCFSMYVFFKNKLYSFATMENEIYKTVNSAVSEFHKAKEDYAVFENDQSSLGKTVKEKYKEAILSAFSSYDFCIMQYQRCHLPAEHFNSLYKQSILAFVKTPEHSSLLSLSDQYPYLKSFLRNENI